MTMIKQIIKYSTKLTFILILFLVWSGTASATVEDVNRYNSALGTIKKSGVTMNELKSAQRTLSSLASRYDNAARICTKMGERTRVRGSGGTFQWVEGKCENYVRIYPDRELASLNNRIRRIEVEEEQALLAAAAKKRQEELAKAAPVTLTAVNLSLNMIESFKDGVLDSLEPLKINVGVANSGSKPLKNVNIRLRATPADYAINKQVSYATISGSRQFALDTIITEVAKAGDVTFIVSITADNLEGTLTKEVVSRVRN